MDYFKKKFFKSAAAMMLAVLLVFTVGCSDEERTENSGVQISEIGNDSEAGDESRVSSESGKAPSSESDAENGEGSQSAEKEYADIEIETPYCTLYFPGDWGGFLETEIDDGKTYCVTFKAKLNSGKEQHLFYITFGENLYDPIGTVTSPEGKTVEVMVGIVDNFSPGDDWTDNEVHIVFTMMELVNEVIAKMPIEAIKGEEQGTSAEGQSGNSSARPGTDELSPEMAADMAIDTPYGELHYPSEWAESLRIEVGEKNGVYSVAFYSSVNGNTPVHLFTIAYNSSEGVFLRTIKAPSGETVEIRVIIVELAFDSGWDESEKSTAYAMQEDINYLIGKIGL